MQKLIQYQLQLNVTENVLQTKLFSGFHNNCEKHWQGFKILNCGASCVVSNSTQYIPEKSSCRA